MTGAAANATSTPGTARIVLLVFVPFVAGYFISYVYRTINALIAPGLTADLDLDPGALGLMTSVYFLTFAAFQLPLGVLVDRFGPRRVQSVLLLVAASGAVLFAFGRDLVTVTAARALIGLGVSGALMAGLKALAMWLPKERLAVANGAFIMLGTAGAVAATFPAEALLRLLGWRELFLVLGGATLALAAVLFVAVPDVGHARKVAHAEARRDIGLRQIYADPDFWRIAPLSASCIATAWAIQGLWAAPWFSDVLRLERAGVVSHLFAMACALSVGALVLGVTADRLRRRGFENVRILGGAAILFICVQAAILLRVPLPSLLLWCMFAIFGSMTVLSFTIVADIFPTESIGRANCALNLLHVGSAFALQYAIGAVVALWPATDGHYPEDAYGAAFGLALALQGTALAWYLRPTRRASLKSPHARRS